MDSRARLILEMVTQVKDLSQINADKTQVSFIKLQFLWDFLFCCLVGMEKKMFSQCRWIQIAADRAVCPYILPRKNVLSWAAPGMANFK